MRLTACTLAGLLATMSALTTATPALAAANLSSAGVRCTIVGTAGDDLLVGTAGNDVVCGLAGDDKIIAGDGDDIVDAGPGNDVVTTQDGSDRVDSGPGDDITDAGGGDDTVTGGPGNDRVTAGPGDDTALGDAGGDRLDGGTGDDTVTGGTGADAIEGGTGINTCTFDNADISPRTSCTDLDAPVLTLSSVRWSAPAYDNSADQTISVRMRITDDRSGVSPDSGLAMQADDAIVYFIGATLVSGTENDGVWEFSTTLPQYAPVGEWHPFQVLLADRVGHRSEAVPATFPTFTVTGRADTSAPVIHAASAVWAADTLDNGEDRDLRVCVRITDDLSGVGDTRVLFFRHEDGTYLGLDGTLVSGTTTDGVWQFSGTLPRYAPTGTWRLTYAPVWDRVGHRAEPPADFPAFTVTGTPDTQGPVADVATAHWDQAAYDNSADRQLRLTMRVTDELSGVAYGAVFMAAEDGTVLGISGELVSGTDTDGIWQFTGTLPAYSPTGIYRAIDVQMHDRVGHVSATAPDFPSFTVTGR